MRLMKMKVRNGD